MKSNHIVEWRYFSAMMIARFDADLKKLRRDEKNCLSYELQVLSVAIRNFKRAVINLFK